MSSSLCRPARFEVPTGLRGPRGRAEMASLMARGAEGGLAHLASPGGHDLNQPEQHFWSMQGMPSAPWGSPRHQGMWFVF